MLFARAHHHVVGKLLTSTRRALRQSGGRVSVAAMEEAYPGGAGGGGYEFSTLATPPAIGASYAWLQARQPIVTAARKPRSRLKQQPPCVTTVCNCRVTVM